MADVINLLTSSPDETFKIGVAFAAFLRSGQSVALIGELGAGKTVFVQGVVAGRGYRGSVTSPTFALVHEYSSAPLIYHIDCFRLSSPRAIQSVGFEEYLNSDGILLVEWADLIASVFDRWHWMIEFKFAPESETQRRICLQPGRCYEHPSNWAEIRAAIINLGIALI